MGVAAAQTSPRSPAESRPPILVVDDEPTVTEVVVRYLERAGYPTQAAYDGYEALRIAEASRPALVVLDLTLPGIDGIEVMHRLREHGPVSVIVLSARDAAVERVVGLQQGADDYMVKPFFPKELVARVEAVLRRVEWTPEIEAPLVFEELEIAPAARSVIVRGTEVALTVREFDLLLFLARHPNQVFSREHLMGAVWDYSFYTDASTVTVHVRRLRVKIEEDPAAPRLIRTVWGVGYRFEG